MRRIDQSQYRRGQVTGHVPDSHHVIDRKIGIGCNLQDSQGDGWCRVKLFSAIQQLVNAPSLFFRLNLHGFASSRIEAGL